MILRRITAAFRRQDWFTVFVETMIVVLGVFLGLQVNNWNAVRVAMNEEAALLVQMHDGFVDDVSSVIDSKEAKEEAIEAIRYILRTIRDGAEPEDRDAFLDALDKSRNAPSYVFEAPIATILISSGGLMELSSPELRQSVVNYRNVVAVMQQHASDQRALFSSIGNGAESGVFLNPDVSSRDNVLYDYDFDLVVANREFYQKLLITTLASERMADELITITQSIIEEIEAAQK